MSVRKTLRRGATTIAAVALVLAGAAGALLLLGPHPQATTTSSGSAGGGTQPAPGMSPWRHRSEPPSWWSHGLDGRYDQRQGQQTPGTTPTSAQLTGLVRIVSTLAYGQGQGVGTGMVLSSDGEVVTNHHVVQGASTVTATVATTGQTYHATVIGTDSRDDVAVLQLQGASGLATVTPASAGVAVAARVTAVGDAGGSSRFSAAPGTVSSVRQDITTVSSANSPGEHLSNLIQVRADVVPGDSGGPLLDASGRVVGMDTAASNGPTRPTGYAIPMGKVLRIAGQIEAGDAGGRIHLGRGAFLGVELAANRAGDSVVGVIPGTPAARAGITAGASITSVDGTTTPTSTTLRRAIATHSPGDRVSITWRTARGASRSATVTLAKGPVS